MNSPVVNSDSRKPIYVLLVAALGVVVISLAIFFLVNKTDAYTEAVLRLAGNPTKGRSIFVMNCVACHGQWADGKVGPSLKNISEKFSSSRIIRQVVSGETPPMPQFQPAAEEMADLLSYLNQL